MQKFAQNLFGQKLFLGLRSLKCVFIYRGFKKNAFFLIFFRTIGLNSFQIFLFYLFDINTKKALKAWEITI